MAVLQERVVTGGYMTGGYAAGTGMDDAYRMQMDMQGRSSTTDSNRVTIFSRPDDIPPRPKHPAASSQPTGVVRLGRAGSKDLPRSPALDTRTIGHARVEPPNDTRCYEWKQVAAGITSRPSSQERAEYAIPTPPTPPVPPARFVTAEQDVFEASFQYKCRTCGCLVPTFEMAITHCTPAFIQAAAHSESQADISCGAVPCSVTSPFENRDAASGFVSSGVTAEPEVGGSGSSTQVGRHSAEYESPRSASQSQASATANSSVLPPASTSAYEEQASAATAGLDEFCYQSFFKCPRCKVLVTSFEAAVGHCSDGLQEARTTAAPPETFTASEPQDFYYGNQATTGFVAQEAAPQQEPPVPTVNADEMQGGSDTYIGNPSASSYASHVGAASAAERVLPQEVEPEQPMICKQLDPETGRQRTVVCNADGTAKAFGWRTVTSLVENNEDETLQWMNSLTEAELKGLLSEVSEHVCEGSQTYMAKKQEVDRLNLQVSYGYFGLTEDATDRDLDQAYRQLSRRMHPDKNGGTEAAKQKFQNMKAHYEALKQSRAEGNKENQEEQGNQDVNEEQPQESEAAGEKTGDEQQSGKDGTKTLNLAELLRSKDRVEIDKAVMNMRAQLQTIRQHMDILTSQQQRLSSSLGRA